MTPDWTKDMRERFERLVVEYNKRRGSPHAWDAYVAAEYRLMADWAGQALDEIERLQARKAAPTREQVDAAIANRVGSWTGIYLVMFKDALEAAGLLATPIRPPHTYWWVRFGSTWQPAFWTGRFWKIWASGERAGDSAFEEIGDQIEGMPA